MHGAGNSGRMPSVERLWIDVTDGKSFQVASGPVQSAIPMRRGRSARWSDVNFCPLLRRQINFPRSFKQGSEHVGFL
jgi:hypothetical protein